VSVRVEGSFKTSVHKTGQLSKELVSSRRDLSDKMIPTVMEGSFGTQIEQYVGNTVDGNPLWCSKFVATDRDKCILAHRDLVRAGTEILTTASYQGSVEGYIKYLGVDEQKAIDLLKDSVYLAKEAVKIEKETSGLNRKVLVAGSVGPYGAYLHDGSDYTGAYKDTVSKETLKKWHSKRFQALIDAGADILGFETIPAFVEAEALIELLLEHPNMNAWLSFSIKDEESISSGENFYECAIKCWEKSKGQLLAVGANCMNPKLVTPLFKKIRQTHPHIRLIAYPNSGEVYDVDKKRWLEKESSKMLTDYTGEWLDLGVSYVGGCCRTNHIDVEQFVKEVNMWKEKHPEKIS